MVNCPRPVIVTKVKEPSVTNPEALPPLLPTPNVVCSGHQHLPPLLPTPNPVKIAIDKLSITESESNSEEFIYQVEEAQDFNSDKENMDGNIEISSTSSPLEVIPVTTKFIHVFPKDSTSIPLEVTPMTTEFDDVLSEDLLHKLSLTCDIQHVVDLIPEASLPDLPHPRFNPIEKTEFEKQVDELSLEGKPQFFIPINIHVYEDKFWNYIMTKDEGQIKNFTIYGQSISKGLKGTAMEETNVIHIINFLAITIKPICAFLQNLPVRISLDVVKITGKLPHTVRMIRLIIPFDRGRVYCDH